MFFELLEVSERFQRQSFVQIFVWGWEQISSVLCTHHQELMKVSEE
jgi:hypothetical protein